MTPDAYIAQQEPERQALLAELHQIIIDNDATVTPVVGQMMGKDMILYNAPGTFKYGLASVKNYMSLHCLPMYGHQPLYAKFKDLLPDASFQKGCINFRNGEEMPPEIVAQLIKACEPIDLKALRDAYLKERKESKKK